MNRLQRISRVRSNSLSTLTVAAQPSSSSRPVLPPNPRIPAESKHSQPSQLALTQPTVTNTLLPYTPPHTPRVVAAPTQPSSSFSAQSPRPAKRQRLRYQLDVGAYGIPKRRGISTNSCPDTSRSVQVGEDAYFVRDNAMGVADGVGGWARSVTQQQQPTPSALFSRRLMHFCSAELDEPTSSSASTPTPQFTFEHHLKPPPLHEELEDTLEDLSDGIDILRILERAYDSTVKAHVSPTTAAPLTSGSSTALLAVLDLPSQQQPPSEPPTQNYAAGSLPAHTDPISVRTPIPLPHSDEPIASDVADDLPSTTYDAVIRIAHLGDCMGMLIRDDDIVWRTDEMWWGYNHPLQLGPTSATSSDPLKLPVLPHTHTLPVQSNDILILASDGLSDNLWDEDVLDEVRRFRRDGGWTFDPHPPSSNGDGTLLRRKAFAGLLSEALCSRAKRVSDRRAPSSRSSSKRAKPSSMSSFSTIAEEGSGSSEFPTPVSKSPLASVSLLSSTPQANEFEDEIPFAHRARMAGRSFRGGKQDDISVIVAVISPAAPPLPALESEGSNSSSEEAHATTSHAAAQSHL